MKTSSEIRHYASKQDYLSRKPSVNKSPKAEELLKNNKGTVEDKVKDVGEKVKQKAVEAKSAGKHLLTQAASAGLRAIPIPSLPSLPGISIPDISNQEAMAKSEEGPIRKPAIFFVKSFEVNPFASEFTSVAAMAENIPGSRTFNWGDSDEIFNAVKEYDLDQPLVLVGEGMGSDTIVEVANRLNTSEGSFRNIDLLVTVNSVGTDNDIISKNVKKNVNFISDEDSLFNDGPNIARDKSKTLVANELRNEKAQELGDSPDIQFSVYQHINETLAGAIVKKNWQNMQAEAFKDSLKSLGLRPNLFA